MKLNYFYLLFLNLFFLTTRGAMNNFVQPYTIAWSQETSLKDIISFFNDLKKVEENITAQDAWFYKNALLQASEAQDKQSIPEHILYKADVAKTIYMLIKDCLIPKDVFNTYLKRHLAGWDKLSPLYIYPLHAYHEVESLNGYEGISVYYSDVYFPGEGVFWQTNIKERIVTRIRNYEFKHYYLSHYSRRGFVQYKKDLSKDPESIFLKCPSEGLLFCTESFFGSIDYTQKTAVMYNLLRQKIDFSNLIPWAKIEGGAYMFFNPVLNRLLFIFHQDDYCFDQYHFKPTGQIMYQLADFINDYSVSKVSEIPCVFKRLRFDKKILVWLMELINFIDKWVGEKNKIFGMLLKIGILHFPLYPSLFFFGKFLFQRSFKRFSYFLISIVGVLGLFYYIRDIYTIELLPSLGIAKLE